MTLDRRRFISATSLGAAGLVIGRAFSTSRDTVVADERLPAQEGGVILRLLLWGSALYAFSNDGGRVTVAYLTADAKVPGCSFVPHHPVLRLPAGGARVIANGSAIAKVGDTEIAIPQGLFRIAAKSLPAAASPLAPVGLTAPAVACLPDGASSDNLSLVPSLVANQATVAKDWEKRFATRVEFTSGALKATKPFHGENDIARWDVKGPNASTSAHAFTDTLLLTIPLAGSTVTFEGEDGTPRLTLGTSGNPSVIEAVLMAHPPVEAGSALKAGDKEPHFCALYSVFDPLPEPSARAELFFKDWCNPPPPTTVGAMLRGPAPGRYCTGAKITM